MSAEQNKPPVSVEQWLSYVIALQSHRSSNQGQKEFGSRLMELVFEKLPSRFEADANARAYFDNTLAEVAWAVRGFSVVRDIYQTNVASLERAKQTEANRIESLQKLSPLASDSVWGKVKGALVGIGLATPLFALTYAWFGKSTPAFVITGAVVIALGLVIAEVAIGAYIAHQLKLLHSSVPGSTLETWRDKALSGYKVASRGFLEKVAAIEKQHYPNATTVTFTEGSTPDAKAIDEIIERAFSIEAAFPATPSGTEKK